jgi:hypothetical protein
MKITLEMEGSIDDGCEDGRYGAKLTLADGVTSCRNLADYRDEI